MGYVLLGDVRSGSAIVELALAELDIDTEVRDVSLEANAQRGDEYAAVNPQRKLPTLITPEGETLTESVAVLLTLIERHQRGALLPQIDERERARALRWLLFVATELYPLIEIIGYPQRFQPERDATTEDRRERVREHVRGIWKQRWVLLEAEIRGQPWFLESGFSVVDIYVAVVSRWAQVAAWRADALPGVEAIAAAVAERPRCRTVWRRHFA